MLKVHLKDGQTLCFDLENAHQAADWLTKARSPAFQAQITGLTISHRGVQYSLPRPLGYGDADVFLHGEYLVPVPEKHVKGGTQIICQAGETRVKLMVHQEQRAARVTVARVGKQRYNPLI